MKLVKLPSNSLLALGALNSLRLALLVDILNYSGIIKAELAKINIPVFDHLFLLQRALAAFALFQETFELRALFIMLLLINYLIDCLALFANCRSGLAGSLMLLELFRGEFMLASLAVYYLKLAVFNVPLVFLALKLLHTMGTLSGLVALFYMLL